jgi:hypothetical protein
MNNEVFGASAMAVRALAMPAAFCLPGFPMRDGCQAIYPLGGQQNHAAPVSSVAAVWASARDVPLAPKTATAVPSLAGLDLNLDPIDEHTVDKFPMSNTLAK